jgi:hypothetical protein
MLSPKHSSDSASSTVFHFISDSPIVSGQRKAFLSLLLYRFSFVSTIILFIAAGIVVGLYIG